MFAVFYNFYVFYNLYVLISFKFCQYNKYFRALLYAYDVS